MLSFNAERGRTSGVNRRLSVVLAMWSLRCPWNLPGDMRRQMQRGREELTRLVWAADVGVWKSLAWIFPLKLCLLLVSTTEYVR